MKNRILTFVIGILVGAIIMTTFFLIYNKTNRANEFMGPMNGNGQMNTNQMPQNGNMMPGNNGDSSNIPEKPDEENSQNQNVTQENNTNS